MDINEFLITPAEATRLHGPHDRIVMSSRVRLARNIRDAAYPGWAKKPGAHQGSGDDPSRR